MGNWQVEPASKPQAITKEAIKALRTETPHGISRRRLLRLSLGLGIGVWLLETAGATLGFLWPNLQGGFGGKVTIGNFKVASDPNNQAASDASAKFTDGAPAYFQNARSFIVLIDPNHQAFNPGDSPEGDGATTNVRTLYQRCTHLGCKPNFCAKNFWFECPCHGSRYDRLGIKAEGLGPAPRSLDRFASTVDSSGTLTIDTSKITLGPLPVALGQAGLIPPKTPTGCI